MIAWKQIAGDRSVKIYPVNISDMHFKDEPPNLMTINFSIIRYIIFVLLIIHYLNQLFENKEQLVNI